jgi:bacteriocin-like protein
MSEETRKVEEIEQEAKESELSEKELDNVAGGGGGPVPIGVRPPPPPVSPRKH